MNWLYVRADVRKMGMPLCVCVKREELKSKKTNNQASSNQFCEVTVMPPEPTIIREKRDLACRPSPHAAFEDRLRFVCSSLLFAGLSEHDCLEIAACARTRTFLREEPLFIQGQPVVTLILLQSGNVKHTQVGKNGNEVILRFSRRGDVVNTLTEPSACGHTCSAHAMEKCSALVWDYCRIEQLLARHPELRDNVSHILAGQLQELEERFREMATEKVATRLALVIRRLLQQIGKPAGNGIQISLSREELAQMTGTTVFTISRVLSEWCEQGVVRSRREAVVVSDPTRLEA
jgi:CRP-like cAMP-binding protein